MKEVIEKMTGKTTRRALLTSALAILACVAMLVGTTFAWFTDTASTAVNTIQSGRLKISLLDDNGNDLTGKTIRWTRKSAATGRQETIDENGQPLWEPGATYRTEWLNICNTGNLALKYKVVVNGFTGDTKLLEALDFTVLLMGATVSGNGAGTKICRSLDELAAYEGYLLPESAKTSATDPDYVGIKITAKMREDAGNEYQGLSLGNLGITVIATQYTYEYDSNGKDYDAEAEYPVVDPIDLTDETDREIYIRNDYDPPYVDGDGNLDNALVADGAFSVGDQTLIRISESFSTVFIQDADIVCGTLVKATAANTYVLMNCNITLKGDQLLDIGQFDQVCIGNVTVNGVRLTEENYRDINSQMVFFYDDDLSKI